jgi:hypothetical protein
MARDVFMEVYSPKLEFCKKKSSLDECNSMLHNDGLDIPCICHSFDLFAPNLES